MCRQETYISAGRLEQAATAVSLPQPASDGRRIRVERDSLRAPRDGKLPKRVQSLLLQGERNIVLDLAAVSRIDASGIGELVRAYNLALARKGVLRIANPSARVREILEKVGLFHRLHG